MAAVPTHLGQAEDTEETFRRLAENHRRELVVYCYRMLGSIQDAEDAVQETLLRAWRRLETFEGRSSFRAWLYRIACNACLDALDTRRRKWGWGRMLPSRWTGPDNPEVPAAPPITEAIWLEPCPDALLDVPDTALVGPEARYEARESVELAFIALVQTLPPRQRAALVLCDVLGWSAAEAATALDSSSVSVNSLLQRARGTMRQRYPEGRRQTQFGAVGRDTLERAVAARYLSAWEAADVDGLVALLRKDARMTMPPTPSWYDGRDAIGRYFARNVFGGPLHMRLVPAAANGQAAFAVYARDASDAGAPEFPLAIKILTVDSAGAVSEITGFTDPSLFPYFGLSAPGAVQR